MCAAGNGSEPVVALLLAKGAETEAANDVSTYAMDGI
jgi:hypothetical protein